MNKIQIKNFNLSFDRRPSLININLDVEEHKILGIIGPAGSGKSTILRCINRLIDMEQVSRVTTTGDIQIGGESIFARHADVVALRRRAGIIFALPSPLPMSIYDNICYGPRRNGVVRKAQLDAIVEKTLTEASLWGEVKDRLNLMGPSLSGGQQQRLCIARTLALEPEIVMMDEPCSGLDPISTAKIEETMVQLKSKYTFIIVTNNTKQAARVSDNVAFFLMGECVEYGASSQMFTVPKDQRTNDYVSGRFG